MSLASYGINWWWIPLGVAVIGLSYACFGADKGSQNFPSLFVPGAIGWTAATAAWLGFLSYLAR